MNIEILEKIKKFFHGKEEQFNETPVFSVDVESTLVAKKSKFRLVSKEDKKALERFSDKGGVILLNSGATYGYLKKVAKGLKCSSIISSNNGAYVTMPNSKKPIVDLKLDPEVVVKIKNKLRVCEPRAIVALSGLDRKYYIDKRSKMIWLFKLQQAFRFRNKYKISTSSKKFKDKLDKVYSLQVFPLPDTPGLTKETKPIKKMQQKEITENALKGLKELLQEDKSLQEKFSIGVGDMGLQICHPKANKANAINAVKNYSNLFLPRRKEINYENIFAAGDGVQDIVSTSVMANPEKQFFTMSCAKPSFFEQAKKVENKINDLKLQRKIKQNLDLDPQQVKLEDDEKFSFDKTIVNSVSRAVEKIERQI